VANRHHIAAAHHCGLGRIVPGYEQPTHGPRPCVGRHGQHTLDWSDAAVEGQLADKQRIFKALRGQKSRARENTYGDGHIECGTVFAQIGWRQVDRDPTQRELKPAVLQRAADAHAALLHTRIRQSHDVATG